jgi:hypothetical protein
MSWHRIVTRLKIFRPKRHQRWRRYETSHKSWYGKVSSADRRNNVYWCQNMYSTACTSRAFASILRLIEAMRRHYGLQRLAGGCDARQSICMAMIESRWWEDDDYTRLKSNSTLMRFAVDLLKVTVADEQPYGNRTGVDLP